MAERHLPLLALALCALSAAFLGWHLRAPFGFILELRATKLAALICVGAATGAATILFQTVAMNRLLTPGIVGFDALFVLLQTLLVVALGGVGAAQIPGAWRFVLEAVFLMAAATALFGLLLRRDASDVTRMILTGVVLGVLLRGLASMVQRMMDPSEFSVVQQAMFASFGRVDGGPLAAATGLLAAALLAGPGAGDGRQRLRARHRLLAQRAVRRRERGGRARRAATWHAPSRLVSAPCVAPPTTLAAPSPRRLEDEARPPPWRMSRASASSVMRSSGLAGDGCRRGWRPRRKSSNAGNRAKVQ